MDVCSTMVSQPVVGFMIVERGRTALSCWLRSIKGDDVDVGLAPTRRTHETCRAGRATCFAPNTLTLA